MIFSYLLNMLSHPSWVCGLKHNFTDCADRLQDVTPFVGVWIETIWMMYDKFRDTVTPFVGVWIETRFQRKKNYL